MPWKRWKHHDWQLIRAAVGVQQGEASLWGPFEQFLLCLIVKLKVTFPSACVPCLTNHPSHPSASSTFSLNLENLSLLYWRQVLFLSVSFSCVSFFQKPFNLFPEKNLNACRWNLSEEVLLPVFVGFLFWLDFSSCLIRLFMGNNSSLPSFLFWKSLKCSSISCADGRVIFHHTTVITFPDSAGARPVSLIALWIHTVCASHFGPSQEIEIINWNNKDGDSSDLYSKRKLDFLFSCFKCLKADVFSEALLVIESNYFQLIFHMCCIVPTNNILKQPSISPNWVTPSPFNYSKMTLLFVQCRLKMDLFSIHDS